MIRLLNIINKTKSLGSGFSGCFFSKFNKKKTPEIIRPKIYAPITYWELSPEEKKEICNGCGAKDGLKVPDTFWGLNMEEACNIHDYMYSTGKTHYDKLFADRKSTRLNSSH